MTKQEEMLQKQLEKISKETWKGFLDAVVYGMELYEVTEDGLKHIPLSDYIQLD